MRYFLIVFFVYIVGEKLIVNTGGSVSGSFQSSNAAYFLAFYTLVFVLFILFKDLKKILFIKNRFYVILPLFYYLLGLILSGVSLLPVVSAFRSSIGIGFILLSGTIGHYLNNFNIDISLKLYYKLLITILIAGIIGKILYSYLYISGFSILNLQAGYIGLISLYIGIWNFIEYKNKKGRRYLFNMILFILIALLLHSFSSFLAFYIAFSYVIFLYKHRIMSLLLIGSPILLLSAVITYLNNNLDTIIFGKPAAAYLIGSGRFDIYPAAESAFYNFDLLHKVLGIGFMAERNILSKYDLTWSIDPHNSFIVSILGLGVLGAFLYLLFIIVPFFMKKRILIYQSKSIFFKWITMHIMFTIFGITSSDYLARPSILLILYIILSFIIFNINIKKEKNVRANITR